MGAKYRLMQYRKKAAESKYEPAQNWRFWHCRNTYDNPRYSKDRKQMFLDSFSIGDDLGNAGVLNSYIRHTGWYCDSLQSGVIEGHVIKLRCPKGTLYIPSTKCTEWDGVTYYLDDAYLVEKGGDEGEHANAIYEVSRTADRCAELQAEESREDDAKYQAESKIETLEEETRDLLKEVNDIRLELTDETLPMVVIKTCEKRVEYCEREIVDNKKKIEELKDNYWKAVENY